VDQDGTLASAGRRNDQETWARLHIGKPRIQLPNLIAAAAERLPPLDGAEVVAEKAFNSLAVAEWRNAPGEADDEVAVSCYAL
jgi:hypothetical protein